VTLGRSGRGPVGRDDRRRPAVADPWAGAVEIEELPAQRMPPGRRGGPGLGGALAIGATVLLLAAGLGVLGGRPQPTSPTAAAGPSESAASTAARYTGEPLVTPTRPCGSLPSGPPGILLEVGERSTLGALEPLDGQPAGAASLGSEGIPTPEPPARVDIRSDVVAEVWTAGRACAVGWTIEIVGPAFLDVLQLMGNPRREPSLASQNRFRLVLASYAGQSVDLRATLVFPDFTVRATWPIRVLSFVPPTGLFSAGLEPIRTVGGCDVELTLGNGWVAPREPCTGDVAADLGEPFLVAPGQRLKFRFDHEDWQIDDAGVNCGHLSGRQFVTEPDCGLGSPERAQFSFTFAAPPGPGVHTLAILTCGTQLLADARNRLCGTWYASVKVRG